MELLLVAAQQMRADRFQRLAVSASAIAKQRVAKMGETQGCCLVAAPVTIPEVFMAPDDLTLLDGPDRLLLDTEVATLMRVKVSTLRRWRRMRAGPAYVRHNPLGRALYRTSDVRRYLEQILHEMGPCQSADIAGVQAP
jgi:hypothetical protein